MFLTNAKDQQVAGTVNQTKIYYPGIQVQAWVIGAGPGTKPQTVQIMCHCQSAQMSSTVFHTSLAIHKFHPRHFQA